MQAIGSWFKIPVIAILVQAIFFAAIHPYNTLGVMSTLITGICYGAITYYSKGIEMSSALHIVNNLLAFWLTGLGLVKIGSNVNITSFLSDLIVMLATILIVYYVSKKQNWFETSTEY